MIRVVIVDDHPLVRDGVVAALESEPDLRVVGQGATAQDARQLTRDLQPDLLLLDIAMPGGGLTALPDLARDHPATRVVMLTSSEDEGDVLAALQAGARGYIVKGVTGRELRAIVRAVQAGEAFVTPALATGVLLGMSGQRRPASPLDELTPRERSILDLVGVGRSNKEIGGQLTLTENTVKFYMTTIMQKLGVHNRVEAALLAHRRRRG